MLVIGDVKRRQHPAICCEVQRFCRSRHGTPEVTPGDLLTVAFVLPSGQPCKLRAVVIHGGRRGWGVQFREGHPQSLTNLSSYWSALEEGR